MENKKLERLLWDASKYLTNVVITTDKKEYDGYVRGVGDNFTITNGLRTQQIEYSWVKKVDMITTDIKTIFEREA